MAYEPSLKVVHAFLDPETRKALLLPLAALITGAFSQVETTIELTNRVCDSVFHRTIKMTTDSGISSSEGTYCSQSSGTVSMPHMLLGSSRSNPTSQSF
jgi:hypothetical protein